MEWELLINWIGAIILILGIISLVTYGVNQNQLHETIGEKCMHDCRFSFESEERELSCIQDCNQLEDRNELRINLIKDCSADR